MEQEDPEALVVKPFEIPSEENERHYNGRTPYSDGVNVNSPDLRLQPDDQSQPHSFPEEDEECFYDCTESLQAPEEKGRGPEREETPAQTGDFRSSKNAKRVSGKTDKASVLQSAVRGPEDTSGHVESVEESPPDSPDQSEEQREETGNEEVEDDRWDGRIEDDQAADADSDTEMKVKEEEVEFDDEHLREMEESLTEEQKEGRRQESLALKEEGNKHFKSGEHQEAERSYTSALGVCPVCYSKERAVLFSNRAAARLHLDLKEKAIADCSKAIDLQPDYVKAILRRAELYEKTDKLDEALDDFKKVLEKDPGHHGARQACMRLPQQIEERNEKLKEEMMSKLKDLGNMFLRPFGLSTNNFQLNQDANTGSYSVNFVQNPSNNNR